MIEVIFLYIYVYIFFFINTLIKMAFTASVINSPPPILKYSQMACAVILDTNL